MGIGIALVFWALVLGVLAAAAAVMLALWSWWNQRRAGRRGLVRPLFAAVFPFLALAYAAALFIVYAIWCEGIRGVDPGIGDAWRVPLAHGYYFCMIDVPDNGYLLKDGCSGAPIVHGITELGANADVVFGKSESNGPFVFDTRSGTLQTFPSIDLAVAGVSPSSPLRSAGDFYNDRRWGWPDAIVAALSGIPVILAALFWYRWFIRRPRPPADAGVARV